MRSLSVFFVSVFSTLLQVKCQLLELNVEELLQQRLNAARPSMGQMISTNIQRSIVNGELARATRFIVDPAAKPSPEMLDFAMFMRRAPRTKEERDAYLELMKQVARRTPEYLYKYVKEEKHKNGTSTAKIDFYALEADVVRRALVYNRMISGRRDRRRNEENRRLQHESHIAQLELNHTNSLFSALTMDPNPATNAATVNNVPVDSTNNTNITEANTGYVTLLDVLSGAQQPSGTGNQFGAAQPAAQPSVNLNPVTPGYMLAGTTDLVMF